MPDLLQHLGAQENVLLFSTEISLSGLDIYSRFHCGQSLSETHDIESPSHGS